MGVRYIVAVNEILPSPGEPKAPFAVPDQAWFELAVWASRMGTFDWDLTTDTLYVSEQNARMFGGARGLVAVDGRDQVFNAVHPDDMANVRAAVAEAIGTGQPYKVEHR